MRVWCGDVKAGVCGEREEKYHCNAALCGVQFFKFMRRLNIATQRNKKKGLDDVRLLQRHYGIKLDSIGMFVLRIVLVPC